VSEKAITEEHVRDEHLRALNVPAHWAYLFGVIGGSLVVMLGLIAILGGSSL
jgi:hypothetical protein